MGDVGWRLFFYNEVPEREKQQVFKNGFEIEDYLIR